MIPLTADHDPERSVIEAIQQGDTYALTELMRRHGHWVRGVIFGVLGRADDVDDVAQKVWTHVWRNCRSLEDVSRWRAWLYRIAHNAATDAGRSKRRHRQLLSGFFRREQNSPAYAHSAEQPLLSSERHDVMLQAIAKLPPLYREPFILKHLQDWSYAQIGDALGLPPDTVETRLVRARRLLREQLAGKV
jgi:RNA polymerase sigma-70 factor, ECF subfamily